MADVPGLFAPTRLKISHRERALQPGEVVLVTLESAIPLREAEAAVFGKRFPFYAGPNPRQWQGLVGIDPDAGPGRQVVRVTATGRDGASEKGECIIEIRTKDFPTRRLHVDERYVTPPKEVEERIQAEARRTEEIFSTLTPRKLWQGPFTVPVDAPAVSSFGRRTILNGQPRGRHWGTDFNADNGTPVSAPNSGKVVLAADLYFSGNTVIIDHGLGLYSFLAHLSRMSVREGAEVRSGDTIGEVGATGRVTGPHLHWSVRLDEVRVDPMSLVSILSRK